MKPETKPETYIEGVPLDFAFQTCVRICQARPEGGEIVLHNYEIMTDPATHLSGDDNCPCGVEIIRIEPKPTKVN